jgi:hypothetical protein
LPKQYQTTKHFYCNFRLEKVHCKRALKFSAILENKQRIQFFGVPIFQKIKKTHVLLPRQRIRVFHQKYFDLVGQVQPNLSFKIK